MKKTMMTLALTVPVLLSLTGCVLAIGNGDKEKPALSDQEDREYHNREKIATLLPDMSYLDVQNKLGIADFNEVYQKDDKKIQVLFYRTHIIKKDGITEKSECTPLVFIDGSLTSWGESAYKLL